jgi:Leucine-rich repeat (LRR) protein
MSVWSETIEEMEHPEKLIDQQIVFKSAMSSNYSKIIELVISQEDITKIEPHNLILKQLGPNLRRFDLSYNYLKQIENLDVL